VDRKHLKKLWIVTLSDGEIPEEAEILNLVAFTSKKLAQNWIDSHPITSDFYENIFNKNLDKYLTPEYGIDYVYFVA
jgi:hypothetical protein